LTRSFVATAHGEFLEAFMYHLLGPPLWGVTVLGAFYHLLFSLKAIAFKGALKKKKPAGEPSRLHRWLVRGIVLVFLAAWAFKLLFIDRNYW
jgi:hypothetical protein